MTQQKYTIEGRPAGDSHASWRLVDATARSLADAQYQMVKRAAEFGNSYTRWEYRIKGLDVPVAPRKQVARRNVKPGSIFRYKTGWHKDSVFEADETHPMRPALHELGLWDTKSLPRSNNVVTGSSTGGDLCEILWEPATVLPAEPRTPVAANPLYTPVAYPATPAPRREYELGWGTGRSLRPELEELEDAKLFRLDTEVHAEANRRRIQLEERQRITEHNRRAEWFADPRNVERAKTQFRNFMTGVAQAMACRTLLRKSKGHTPYGGKEATGGQPWTSEDLALASRQMGGMVAPWAVTADRFGECMKYPAWRAAIGSTLRA